MKDHKQVKKTVWLEGPLDGIIAELKELSEGLIGPQLDMVGNADWRECYSTEVVLSGWRPMTENEIAVEADKAKKTAERKAYVKAKKTEMELKEYERLHKKYGQQ